MSAVDDDHLSLVEVGTQRLRPLALATAWVQVVAWMAVIVFLSGDQFADANTAAWFAGMPFVDALGLPPAVVAAANLIVRKCAHFVEYAVLSGLTLRAARATWPGWAWRTLLALALGLAVVHASLDELRQYLATSMRTGAFHDVALDAAGALTGALLARTYLAGRWDTPRT